MMTNLRIMSWLFFTIIVLSLNCCNSSTIVVGGSVYCDTCSHHYFSKSSHFISGAMVAIECTAGGGSILNNKFTRVLQTNEKGEFQTHILFSPKTHNYDDDDDAKTKRINHCSVKLIHSGDPNCTIPSGSSSNVVPVLKSRKNGALTFSAGAFSFKPLNPPTWCSQKNLISVNQKEFLNPITPDSPVVSSPPSIPIFQPTPPLISINIPPLLNMPPLTNYVPIIPLPSFPSFKPVPGFPGIPSRSSSLSKENSP